MGFYTNNDFFEQLDSFDGIKKHKSCVSFDGIVEYSNLENNFKDMCNLLINGNKLVVNKITLDNTILILLIKNIDVLQNIIIDTLYNYTKKFNIDIQNSLNNNYYYNEWFIDKYNEFFKNSIIFKKSLNVVDDYLKLDGKNIIDIYVNYIFYHNIINVKYNNLYLYEIFLQNHNIENIKNVYNYGMLFKIQNYFNGFSFSMKKYTNLLFNEELFNIFKNSQFSSNTTFINSVNIEITENIKKLLSNKKNTLLIDTIQLYIKMCLKFNNKKIFMTSYLINLCDRLQNDKTNYEIEKILLSLFKPKDETEIYEKILNCINDIMLSKKITKNINLINPEIESDKFISFKKQKYQIDYQIIGNNSWSGLYSNNTDNCYDDIILPVCFDYNYAIINKVLNNNDNTKISINYDKSIVIMNIEYPNCPKLFEIKMTLLQSIVFMTINNNNEITAIELEQTIGIHLVYLTPILNSLIKSKIIKRNKTTENNDINMKFIINSSFQSNAHKICLIKELESIKNISQNQTKLLNINNKIIEYFIQYQNIDMSYVDIKNYLTSQSIDCTISDIFKVINKLINSKIIKSSICFTTNLIVYKMISNTCLVNDKLVNDNLVNDNLVNSNLVNDNLVNSNLVNDNLVNDKLVNDNLVNDTLVNGNLVNNNLVNDNTYNSNVSIDNDDSESIKSESIKSESIKLESIKLEFSEFLLNKKRKIQVNFDSDSDSDNEKYYNNIDETKEDHEETKNKLIENIMKYAIDAIEFTL
jgi:hypothetical protein